MTSHGVIFMASAVWLIAVVSYVYSVAQAPQAPEAAILRHSARRVAKLGGVLAGLAVVVKFLSQ